MTRARLASLFTALLLLGCRTVSPKPAEAPPPPPVTRAPAPPLVPDDPDARLAATLGQLAAGEAVRACYERELALDPVLVGRLTMRFTVAADGSTRDIAAEEDTLGSPIVVRCLTAEIARWAVLPPPAEPTFFALPFVFSPGR